MAQEIPAQQQQPVTMTPLPRAEDLPVVDKGYGEAMAQVVAVLMGDAERQAAPMRPSGIPEPTAAPEPPPDESPTGP